MPKMFKSFASNPKAKYWSKKNNVSPKDVSFSSHKKFLFDCPDCKHEIETSPNQISGKHFCAYCTNRRLCNDVGCSYCLDKSFAANEKAIHWC